MSTNLKELSKQGWKGEGTVTDIQTGCLQRIADATEAMATYHVKLLKDLDMYKKWYEEESKTTRQLQQQLLTKTRVASRFKNELHAIKNKLKCQQDPNK